MSAWFAESESELASLRRQLAEARENLRLIQERKSQYVMGTDIPFQLIKEEQQLLERIEELKQRVQGAEGTSEQAIWFATPMQTLRQLKVFLCHASGDKPAVRDLYRRLRSDGIAPWLAEEDLLPGQAWQLEIPKAVRSSDAVIICLSSRAITKAGYVQKEIKDALDVADKQPEGAIFLIPLRLEECEVPERLRRWQWVDLFQEKGYERLFRALRARAESLDPARPGSAPETVVIPSGESLMGSDPGRDKNASGLKRLWELLREALPEIIGGLVVAAVLAIIGGLRASIGTVWAIVLIAAGVVCLGSVYVVFNRTSRLRRGGRRTWKYSRWRRLALAGLVFVLVLCITIAVVLPESRQWLGLEPVGTLVTTPGTEPADISTSASSLTSSPASTPMSLPTPSGTGKVRFYDDFDTQRYWTEGRDQDGQSWYGDGGYNVLSLATKRGWIWPMPERLGASDPVNRSFTDAIIEVDVMPVTDGRVTGYGIVVGWEKGGYFYAFEVHPNGSCGFMEAESQQVVVDSTYYVCPQPVQGQVVRVRLEIQGKHALAFIDGQCVAQQDLPDYHGGQIGLESYNSGLRGSGVTAQVRFDNLVVWDTPSDWSYGSDPGFSGSIGEH